MVRNEQVREIAVRGHLVPRHGAAVAPREAGFAPPLAPVVAAARFGLAVRGGDSHPRAELLRGHEVAPDGHRASVVEREPHPVGRLGGVGEPWIAEHAEHLAERESLPPLPIPVSIKATTSDVSTSSSA
jgi:hypothetical protein